MKIWYPIIVLLVSLLLSGGSSQDTIIPSGQKRATIDLKVVDFEGLQSYLVQKDQEKTYVLNFWATWCAPCVKELPYFEQLHAAYGTKNVEVILVSLDFPKQIDSKLKPFLEKHQLQSEVILLDDVDSNSWIPKVDPNWSGAIPATIIYNKKKRQFYERSFNYDELEKEVQQFIK